jgi:V8-like Glu-specific endopeptidase
MALEPYAVLDEMDESALFNEETFLDDDLLFDEEAYADKLVFPPDQRFPITATGRLSTRNYPFSNICLLEDASRPWFPWCTGNLITPRVVLTASHCLTGVDRIRVTPGADSSASARRQRPFGSQIVPSERFRRHATRDYGIIILPRSFRHASRFMLLQPRSARNTLTKLSIAGYPRDKAHGTMWGHSQRISSVTPTQLTYTLDTHIGHSGSPVWLLGGGGTRIQLAVHTHGGTLGPRGTVVAGNRGERVNCEMIRTIQGWCRAAGVRGPGVDAVAFRRACSSGRELTDSAS